jgi:hypothetical protein
LKRPVIDRRLAAGEPVAPIARDYELNPSSLHRHRQNCLKLGSSNDIKKAAAQGTAAVTLLPSRESLCGAFMKLCERVDEVVEQSKQAGSLSTALSGLNAIRQNLNSLVRLAGHDRAASLDTPVSRGNGWDVAAVAERLIQEFDQEPDLKSRIASALLKIDQQGPAPREAANGGAAATSEVQSEAHSTSTPAISAAAIASTGGATESRLAPATAATDTNAAPVTADAASSPAAAEPPSQAAAEQRRPPQPQPRPRPNRGAQRNRKEEVRHERTS